MGQGALLAEKKESVGMITLNRPDKSNSLTPEMLEQFTEIFGDFAEDASIRAVILRGSGEKVFCAGYDIRALPVHSDSGTLAGIKAANPLENALHSIETYPYPVIAMLNGHAFGAGCELALACDFRIGLDDIRMGMPPARIGIVYSASGLQRFIRTIGLQHTREMFFTGDAFSGRKLIESGLLDRQLPRTELESAVYEFSKRISGNAPLAVKGMKTIIRLIHQNESLQGKDLALADSLVLEAFQSDDLKEGQMAFLEKRKPVFTGK